MKAKATTIPRFGNVKHNRLGVQGSSRERRELGTEKEEKEESSTSKKRKGGEQRTL